MLPSSGTKLVIHDNVHKAFNNLFISNKLKRVNTQLSLCSVTAVCLGTMYTMSVTISKALPTPPPSPSARYRSCPSPVAPLLNLPDLAGEPAAMIWKEKQRYTLHPSSIIIIIIPLIPLIHIITLTVIPLAINRQYPPMPTSTMPTCPRFSP